MKTFDVAIAGGGLIGGSIALQLAQAGLCVAVCDQGQPGQEASWAGAGILSPAPENAANIPMVELAKASMALYPRFVGNVEEISGQGVELRQKGMGSAFFPRAPPSERSRVIPMHGGRALRGEPMRADDARE